MRSLYEGVLNAWRGALPFAIIVFRDSTDRNDVLNILRAEGRPLTLLDSLEGLDPQGEDPVVLEPKDPVATLRSLEGRREHFINRRAPIALLLVSGGDGVAELANCPALNSLVRRADLDILDHMEVDVLALRRTFEAATGQAPETWLAVWKRGEMPDTETNQYRLTDALFLLGDVPP